MARVPPRRPDWLVSEEREAPRPAELPHPRPLDNTVRVLEFPPSTAAGPRRAGSAASEPLLGKPEAPVPMAHARAASLDGLRASVLSPEPAYKSILGRLARGGSATSSAVQPDAPQALSTVLSAVQPNQPSFGAPPALVAQPAEPAHLPLPAHQQQPQQRRPAPPTSDPALQLQLKERIERAKAEIKQQLSPLFRVSQTLLASRNPEQAAQALDEVAAAGAGGGLDLLAPRPGSAAAWVDSGSGQGVGLLHTGSPGGENSAAAGAAAEPAVRDNPLFEQAASMRGPERQLPGSPLAADDVDSLVLSARAAVSKAQSTIADLSSPPRYSPPVAPPTAAPRTSAPSAAPMAMVAHASLPLHSHAAVQAGGSPDGGQLQQPQRPLGSLLEDAAQQLLAHSLQQQQQQQQQQPSGHRHDHHQQQQPGAAGALVPLEPEAADLEGRIAQLRLRSELVIRHECDKLVASMHAMYDEFLASVQERGLLVRVSVGGGAGAAGGAAAGGAAAAGSRDSPRAVAPPAPLVGPAQESAEGEEEGQHGATALRDGASSSSAGGEAGLDGGSSENLPSNSLEAAGAGFEFPLASTSQAGRSGSSKPAMPRPAPGLGQCDGLGFGSPIRLSASQRPSPIKNGHGAGSAASRRPPQPGLLSAHQQSLSFSLAATGTPATAGSTAALGRRLAGGTAAAQGPPATGDSFRTARSSLGLGSLHSAGVAAAAQQQQQQAQPLRAASRLQQLRAGQGTTPANSLGSLHGGGAGAASSSFSTAASPGAGRHRDLDSIIGSIRRMAAETRLKHSSQPSASSRLLHPASSASAGGAPKPRALASLLSPGSQGSPVYSARSQLSGAAAPGSIKAAWPQQR